jgi:formylglycine-generating enzyme required for sulfatase activity
MPFVRSRRSSGADLRRAGAVLALLPSVVVACVGLGGLTGGADADAGIEGGGATEDVTAPLPDGTPPAADGSLTTDGGRCPPNMLLVGTVCVDTHETRNVEYKEFLDSMEGALGAQPAYCSANTTHLPYAAWPYNPGAEQEPVPNVSWCSAYAYCKWAGKRLCGRIGLGDPVPTASVANASFDEWFATCSDDGKRVYPYGPTFLTTACNTASNDAGKSLPVGAKTTCRTPGGIFDMAGNASEWENACEAYSTDGGGAGDVCYARGGDWKSDGPGSRCSPVQRLFRSNHAGIRCCATPGP